MTGRLKHQREKITEEVLSVFVLGCGPELLLLLLLLQVGGRDCTDAVFLLFILKPCLERLRHLLTSALTDGCWARKKVCRHEDHNQDTQLSMLRKSLAPLDFSVGSPKGALSFFVLARLDRELGELCGNVTKNLTLQF